MIDAKELRIGNWVGVPYPIDISLETYTAGKEIAQVISINKNNTLDLLGIEYPKTSWINCTMAEPIPLTTEILLKCGFVNVVDNVEWDLPDGSFYVVRSYGTDYFRHLHTPLKYLHKLQNLYFALTETELEIKL